MVLTMPLWRLFIFDKS